MKRRAFRYTVDQRSGSSHKGGIFRSASNFWISPVVFLSSFLIFFFARGELFGQKSADPLAELNSGETVAAVATSESQKASRNGVEFLGVLPGKTMMAELQKHPIFGKPVVKEVSGEFLVLTYRLPDLPETPIIQLLTKDDRVEGVVVHLESARDLADARKSFEETIKNIQPITVPDSTGNFREIYPEKGFVFVLEKDGVDPRVASTRVIQIIAETVKPDFFTVRAAQNLKKNFGEMSLSSIRSDAEKARELDAGSAPAAWILAQVARMLEDDEIAKTEAIAAIRVDESVPQYHLTLLNILNDLGDAENGLRYDEAVKTVCEKQPLLKAELQILRGDFLRGQADSDVDAAISNHRAAIEQLLPLMKNESKEIRTTAKQLVFRAYISLAIDIVNKEWPAAEDKEKAFLWIDAAAEVAGNLIRNDGHSSNLLLELCLGAVEVGLAVPECRLADPYLEKIAPLGDLLTKKGNDPLNLQMVYWKCGCALFGASQIMSRRSDSAKAAEYADAALRYLDPFCEETPKKVLAVLGPIDYDIGTLLAAGGGESVQVHKCYERAIRMIEGNIETASALDNAENGIRLVNIGKSFWTSGDRTRGIELTRRGVELIERGVDAEVLDASELDVPRKNLETMTRILEPSQDTEAAADAGKEAPAETDGETLSDAQDETPKTEVAKTEAASADAAKPE